MLLDMGNVDALLYADCSVVVWNSRWYAPPSFRLPAQGLGLDDGRVESGGMGMLAALSVVCRYYVC